MKYLKLFEMYKEDYGEVLYHGSDSDYIEEFDLGKLGKRSSKLGFFFTDDIEFSKMFGSNVFKYRVLVDNPKIIAHDEWYDLRDIKNGDDFFISYREKLIGLGYDSVLIDREDDGMFSNPKILISFYNSQIKKA
jgi:hypothetical protein